MNLGAVTYRLVNLGINDEQTTEVSSRIRIINKFNLLCISYSIPYILFSVYFNFIQSAAVFSIGVLFYRVSLECNKKAYFNTAKFLILFATNFSVFYLSLFYGFSSGFHLYYFTSPLIVFSLFHYNELSKIIIGFFIYLSSVSVLIYLNSTTNIAANPISEQFSNILYSVNVFLALSFCILLVTYFSEYNSKVNRKLVLSNNELENKSIRLEHEIIERKETEDKLGMLLKDKETLLSETHHRVKNNLAVVSGMLDLQSFMYDDHQIKDILADSRGRIKTMSLIHESLYKYDNLSKIEFGRYLHSLAEEIRKTNSSTPLNVVMKFDIEEIYLDVTQAIPCGLLVNEVLTNAFKHAFSEKREGEIFIQFKQKGADCTLVIRDNGKGIDVSRNENPRSIGVTLIDAFVKQLKGQYQIINDSGTKLMLTFEHNKL
jgi:two-component sensor histidine kinase